MKIIDFTNIGSGTLVCRSDHWKKERFIKKNARKEIGIIIEKTFYQDEISGAIVCWPIIHWEGGITSSLCHPANISLFRKKNMKNIKFKQIEE